MSLITKHPPLAPKLNRKRAKFVLTKIDEILAWEQRMDTERDTRFVELGRYLCEVRRDSGKRLSRNSSNDFRFSSRQYCPARIREPLESEIPIEQPRLFRHLIRQHLDELGYSLRDLAHLLFFRNEDELRTEYLGERRLRLV